MRQRYAAFERLIGNNRSWMVVVHGVCLLVCGSLAFTGYWLINQPNDLSQDGVALAMPIEEAERLLDNASMWKDELAQARTTESKLMDDAATAVAWLPEKFDWQQTMTEVQNLAESCDLVLVEMRPGDEFAGSRVAIHTATCQLEGSYESVCQFLDGLTKLEHPIWTSEMTVQNDSDGGPLSIVTHLRMPVSGQRTASAYLLEKLLERELNRG